jgi:hypothetical protein
MKRIVLLVTMLAMLAFMAAPALALPQDPESHGPPHANSICSFSGINDDQSEGRVQSYGQIVGALAKDGIHANAGPGPAAPGTECNGHLAPLQEGNPEA